MTKSTITRERLAKIKSWRETYGAGSNVMLPAEEAEELACLALAAMDGEPVAEVLSNRPGNDTSTIDRALPVGTQLYRHAQPALVIPDEMTAEQAYEIGYYYGDPVNVFARGANWMRQHIIDSTLAAAQHDTPALNSVQSVVTVPGKWIPVSERMPLTHSADCEYSDIEVNVFDGERVFTAHYATGSQPQPWGYWVDTYANITHWQPLPAAPQEVKP